MDIVVARYNNMTGVSRRKDKEFKKRLPKFTGASTFETFARGVVRLRRLVVDDWRNGDR